MEVYDRPSPPRNLAVTDIKAESCYLTWDAPLDNGGSEITHYIIDKRDASRKKAEWEEVTNTAVERRYGIWKLIPNGQYEFRVRAVNKYGTSDESNQIKWSFKILTALLDLRENQKFWSAPKGRC